MRWWCAPRIFPPNAPAGTSNRQSTVLLERPYLRHAQTDLAFGYHPSVSHTQWKPQTAPVCSSLHLILVRLILNPDSSTFGEARCLFDGAYQSLNRVHDGIYIFLLATPSSRFFYFVSRRPFPITRLRARRLGITVAWAVWRGHPLPRTTANQPPTYETAEHGEQRRHVFSSSLVPW